MYSRITIQTVDSNTLITCSERMGSFCKTEKKSFVNPISGQFYSEHICAYTIVLILAFKSISVKLCNIHCDINEKFIVAEIRL